MILDTHTLLWAAGENPKLSAVARAILASEDQDLWISTASAWEIATKFRLGKLPEAESLLVDFTDSLKGRGFRFLSLTADQSLLAGSFPMLHNDPFDRLIAAQAKLENMPVLSADTAFDQFPIQRIW